MHGLRQPHPALWPKLQTKENGITAVLRHVSAEAVRDVEMVVRNIVYKENVRIGHPYSRTSLGPGTKNSVVILPEKCRAVYRIDVKFYDEKWSQFPIAAGTTCSFPHMRSGGILETYSKTINDIKGHFNLGLTLPGYPRKEGSIPRPDGCNLHNSGVRNYVKNIF